MPDAFQLDAVIIGGGAAGLWTLDRLLARGYQAILLEAYELGSGQTAASQGIIHGGLKYTLSGMLTPSAQAIRDMPLIWRECLAGIRQPMLPGTIVRSEFCYLWRTESLASRVGMIGARLGLRTASTAVADGARPSPLANCPGTVARVDEQVIDAPSFIADLGERHRQRILRIDFPDGFDARQESSGWRIALQSGEHTATLRARHIVLTAGGGNEEIRDKLGLTSPIMQHRPLHMVMVRGRELPPLFGHCVDSAKTRVTITSATDSSGRTVWQVGGQVAEDGVAMAPPELIDFARRELDEALAGFDLRTTEWATYRVDRAELASGGSRPDDAALVQDGSVLTVWPTKLALAPRAAERVLEIIARENPLTKPDRSAEMNFNDWPRPQVAQPPWETQTEWFADV